LYRAGSLITAVADILKYKSKPKGKRPPGIPRHRWVDNVKMNLREIGCGGVYWIDLAQDKDQSKALVNTVNEPFGFHKMLGNS
jgi:hypothetical protein